MTEEVTQALEKAIHEKGPVAVDFMGDALAWCPIREIGEGAQWHRLAHLPTDLSEERARTIFDAAMRDARQGVGVWIREPAIAAMQQYAAGLQGENQRLRIGYDALAPLVDYLPHPHCVTATDAIRTALGDTQ